MQELGDLDLTVDDRDVDRWYRQRRRHRSSEADI
jgi:hypothetical protein